MARRGGARERACQAKCAPNPKPRSKPEPSSTDVAERGLASIGVRSSKTWVWRGVCVGGAGRAFYYTYIHSGKRQSCEWSQLVGVVVAETFHPACVSAREEKLVFCNIRVDKRIRKECFPRIFCRTSLHWRSNFCNFYNPWSIDDLRGGGIIHSTSMAADFR